MVRDTPPSQDVSTHQIWYSYLKEYRRYGPDTKAGRTDGRTDGRTVRLLYASQSSFGGIIKSQWWARKRIHYLCGCGIEKSVPRDHCLSSLGKSRDCKRQSSRWIFLSHPHTHDGYIWAVTWDFQQCGMCDQQTLRPACAYAQSDQNFCKSLEHSMSVSYWWNSIWSF